MTRMSDLAHLGPKRFFFFPPTSSPAFIFARSCIRHPVAVSGCFLWELIATVQAKSAAFLPFGSACTGDVKNPPQARCSLPSSPNLRGWLLDGPNQPNVSDRVKIFERSCLCRGWTTTGLSGCETVQRPSRRCEQSLASPIPPSPRRRG